MKVDDDQDKLIVGYNDEENVSKKAVKTFVQSMDEQRFKRGILVYKKKMTPAAKKVSTWRPGGKWNRRRFFPFVVWKSQ